MAMKIYYQINNNDCGIAVTQTLINYFFRREVTKEELYQEANIRDEGLSILDLELLNAKYGVRLDSYSMDFEEFRDYSTKHIFLLVINRNGEQHYTIAKKKGNRVTLFDPSLGRISLSTQEMEPLWLGIFIGVSAEKSAPEIRSFPILKPKPDTVKLLTIFSVNVVVLILSLLNNYLIKYSIGHVFGNHDFSNLIKILSLCLLCHLIFHLGELVESWLLFKHRNHYSTSMYEALMDGLKNKKNSYFRKMGRNQFLILRDHIDCIASYKSEYVNRWYISVFTLLVIGAFFLYTNPYFSLLIVFAAPAQFLFWKLTKGVYNRILPSLNDIHNNGKRLLYSLEKFLGQELNSTKLASLIDRSKKNWSEELIHRRELFWKQSLYSRLNSCFNHLIYIVVFALVSYYISSGHLHFGSLLTAHFLYFHISKSFGALAGYYGFKPRYIYSNQIYSQLLHVDSFSETQETLLPPTRIYVKNLFYSCGDRIIFRNLNLEIPSHTIIYGPSGSGKTVLYRLLVNKLTPSLPSIYFDDRELSSLDPSALRDLCIYQVSDGHLSPEDLSFAHLNGLCDFLKDTILHICSLMNLDLTVPIAKPESLSSGQRQLVNILSLMRHQNRVLLLDEVASHIGMDARLLVYRHLIPHLAKSNFVVCSEHTPEIIPFFPNQIDICSV